MRVSMANPSGLPRISLRFIRATSVARYRTNSRIALSSPSSVSGYIRPPISCRIMRIECV